MIKKLLSLAIMVSAMLSLSSCLNNDDNDDITYYDDTAITAFSLGTVNRVVHTTARDGSDSTYVGKYDASVYRFYIDQVNALIYNPDSLPKGSDATHMVCAMTTKNSGNIVLHLRDKWGQDSVAYYSSTDSIDFSQPKSVRVYNMRGTAYCDYTIQVNVHQQSGSEFNWGKDSVSDGLAQVAGRKMVDNNGIIYLFGNDGTQTVGYRKSGDTWQRLASTLADPEAYKSIVAKDGRLYTVSAGQLCSSTDGQSWTTMATPNDLGSLIGATGNYLYGMANSDHHIMRSADNGLTWVSDSLDSSVDELPLDNISLTCKASATNDSTNILLLVGTRNGQTRIWQKVEENSQGSQHQPWAFFAADEHNNHTLPALSGLQVINYDGGLLALGGDFTTFYFSQDNGLTWFTNSDYALPEEFGKTAVTDDFTMLRDNRNIIYISKPHDARIWSGRIARLGWATNQTSFTE